MIRVAVVGVGYWGPNLARNFNSAEASELYALCDLDESRLAAVNRNYPAAAAFRNVQEALSDADVDAVAIATPVHTHYGLAKAALEAGKHVLVEKPLTDSVATAEELVRMSESKGLVLMVDHVFVYSSPVRKMKEILDSGQLGDLFFIDSVRINLWLFQQDVNVVWDLAPHDLSIVDYLVERLPRSVSAFGAVHAGRGIEDVAYLNLDFGNGLIANFHVNWLSPVKIRYTMVGGSQKSVVYNHLDGSEPIKVYDRGIDVGAGDDRSAREKLMVSYRSGDVWSPNVKQVEALRTVVEHFCDCIANAKKPITSGVEGLRVVQVLAAAQHSIKAQGGRITL
jgi:predicted dehydrogenase